MRTPSEATSLGEIALEGIHLAVHPGAIADPEV